MPKICDPPPFTGGQCGGIYYDVIWRFKFVTVQGQLIDQIKTNNERNQAMLGPLGGMTLTIALHPNMPPVNGASVGNYWVRMISNGQSIEMTSGQRYFRDMTATVISVRPKNGRIDNCGNLPTNCRCSDDSCRIDCPTEPNGFCCIDHSVTNASLNLLS